MRKFWRHDYQFSANRNGGYVNAMDDSDSFSEKMTAVFVSKLSCVIKRQLLAVHLLQNIGYQQNDFFSQIPSNCRIPIGKINSNDNGALIFRHIDYKWTHLCMLTASWLTDVIWRHISGSTLAQVMTWGRHYLNQCWLIISEVQWPEDIKRYLGHQSLNSVWKCLI